jgi:hypothetical protein
MSQPLQSQAALALPPGKVFAQGSIADAAAIEAIVSEARMR